MLCHTSIYLKQSHLLATPSSNFCYFYATVCQQITKFMVNLCLNSCFHLNLFNLVSKLSPIIFLPQCKRYLKLAAYHMNLHNQTHLELQSCFPIFGSTFNHILDNAHYPTGLPVLMVALQYLRTLLDSCKIACHNWSYCFHLNTVADSRWEKQPGSFSDLIKAMLLKTCYNWSRNYQSQL